MRTRERNERWLRWLTLAVSLALPTLTLVPLGSFWLWQNGYLLYWAAGACACVGGVYFVQRRWIDQGVESENASDTEDKSDPDWTALETQAWEDVLRIAAKTRPTDLRSREAVALLGLETIETVAKRLHPEVPDPLWRFTIPEALLITERVSARLRRFVDDTIPFSDRITVAQALALYRWRGAVEMAEKAYDVWRLVRLANPAAAATHELRERFSRQMVSWGRKHVARVLVDAYVEEVGRAAIDLYGGRLRGSVSEPAQLTGVLKADAEPAGEAIKPSRWHLPRMVRQAGRAGRLVAGSFVRRSPKK